MGFQKFETELIKRSRDFVEKYLQENINEQLYYHNFKHLQDVADAANEIGQATNLNHDQLETVIIAAWFHDTGYSQGWENHEFVSKNLAAKFLQTQGVSEEKISAIGGCIIATKMPQRPTNLMEEVLCDADLNHISSEEFFTKSEMLRKEISARNDTDIKKIKWFKESLKFIKSSNYFTPYAKEKYLPAKKQNVAKLKSLVKQIKEKKKNKKNYEIVNNDLHLTGVPVRGVETLFRITSKNHIDI